MFCCREKHQQVTHTHAPTENNTPDTDTHAHDKNNIPNPQTNTSHKHLTKLEGGVITARATSHALVSAVVCVCVRPDTLLTQERADTETTGTPPLLPTRLGFRVNRTLTLTRSESIRVIPLRLVCFVSQVDTEPVGKSALLSMLLSVSQYTQIDHSCLRDGSY